MRHLAIFDGKDYDDWCVKMDAILDFMEKIMMIGVLRWMQFLTYGKDYDD